MRYSRILAALAAFCILSCVTAEASPRRAAAAPRVDPCGIGRDGASLCPGMATVGAGQRAASRARKRSDSHGKAAYLEITHARASGPGIVRSHKTGATARVSPRFAPIAQAVVDAMEAAGATIKFMGGYRPGPCSPASLHPCGLAIDLCQLARGVVDRRCNMPSRSAENAIARANGAFSGGEWCNQDRGHIQMLNTAGRCGQTLYSAVGKFKAAQHAHHRHPHYARAQL